VNGHRYRKTKKHARKELNVDHPARSRAMVCCFFFLLDLSVPLEFAFRENRSLKPRLSTLPHDSSEAGWIQLSVVVQDATHHTGRHTPARLSVLVQNAMCLRGPSSHRPTCLVSIYSRRSIHK